MFSQTQIGELKETFSIIDHDADGFIDKEDLKDMLNSLGMTVHQTQITSRISGQRTYQITKSVGQCVIGQPAGEDIVERMINEAPGNINFTMFLTMLGERLNGTDSEEDLLRAFDCFDEVGDYSIDAEFFREYITSNGDRLDDDQVQYVA